MGRVMDGDTIISGQKYKKIYDNETKSRVPLSDWYFTDSGNYVAFIGRSVVGGHWMKVLLDKCLSGELMTGIGSIHNSQ